MKYSINTKTDTITLTLPDGETLEVPKSDPAWDDIIEGLFGGLGSENEWARCIDDLLKRRDGR
jgi:hypothetical protein